MRVLLLLALVGVSAIAADKTLGSLDGNSIDAGLLNRQQLDITARQTDVFVNDFSNYQANVNLDALLARALPWLHNHWNGNVRPGSNFAAAPAPAAAPAAAAAKPATAVKDNDSSSSEETQKKAA